jgi:hypothetical protein
MELADGETHLEWYRIDSSSVPARVAHAQAVPSGGAAVYLFGGRSGIDMSEQAMNDVWKLDCSGPPGQERWSHVPILQEQAAEEDAAAAAPPEPRSFHRMIAAGDKLYVFGGCGASGRLADLHSFDPERGAFRSLAPANLRGRGGPNLLPLAGGTKVGVVAGFAGEETCDGQVYDVASGVWEDSGAFAAQKLAGMRPRSVCASASFPSAGIAVIFGGEVNPSDRGHEGAGGFANDLVVLNELDGSLLETVAGPPDEDWPCPRGWADAASIDHGDGTGSMYLFGGLTGDDANPKRLDDLWRLDISKPANQACIR